MSRWGRDSHDKARRTILLYDRLTTAWFPMMTLSPKAMTSVIEGLDQPQLERLNEET